MTQVPQPVAIIGAACRLPAAEDVDGFWRLLHSGRDALRAPTDETLLAAGVTPAQLADPDYVRAVLRTPGVEEFDAAFFGMSDDEADRCDPALRMLLETAHTAAETAGYDITALAHGTGVVAAGDPGRYAEVHLGTGPPGTWTDSDPAAFVSGRLGLRGPSLSLTTGSLAAVATAVRAVQSGECDIALAGGTHVEIPYGHGYRWQPGAGRPADGRSRPFDQLAAGCVPGSGSAVVVLKRLDQALSDGDEIWAVVRSAVTGHAGAPAGTGGAGGPDGWAEAVAEALLLAEVKPAELSYVQACGMALRSVDAQEIAALDQGLRLAGGGAGDVRLGAVTSAIGHVGQAAGAAGLLAAVLALRHEQIPATGAGTRPDPALRMEDTPLDLVASRHGWPRTAGAARFAAVHEVTAGGANAVLVLQEGPTAAVPPPAGRPELVAWSGPTAVAADAAGRAVADFLDGCAEADFADAAATLLHGRTAHAVRRAVVADSPGRAAELIRSGAWVGADGPATSTAVTGIAVIDPAPAAGTALPVGLYGTHRAFTEAADLCLEAAERRSDALFDRWQAGSTDEEHAAPLTFVARYAMLAAWRSYGVVVPADTGVAGIAAAALAGLLDLDGALTAALAPPRENTPSPVGPYVEVDLGAALTEADLLGQLARAWVAGVAVDRTALARDGVRRLPVPGQPYQRRRHWVVPENGPAAPQTAGLPAAPAPAPAPEPAGAVPGLPPSQEPLRAPGRTAHAFWVLDQLAPGSGVSNIGIAFRTATPLRWWPLQTAAQHLLRRHPALRLRFPQVGGVPVRHLTPPDAATTSIRSRTTTPETLVVDLQEFLHEPFDLERDHLFRVGHFTLPDGGSVVGIAAHHIVVDAPSVQILVAELGRAYDGLSATGRVPAEIAGEAPLLAEPVPEPESVRYWLDTLRGASPETMVLPGSRDVGARPTFAGHTCSWAMDDETQEALRALAQRLHTSENVVLTSVFCLTLLRHGAGPDLLVGVPVGTRRPQTAQLVGYGVTTMPLRVRVDPRAGFADLAARVADAFFAGIEHADVSVEQVLTERGHRTSEWRVPLFRHMFNYRPWSDDAVRICGQVPDYIEDLFDRSRLDLQLVAVPERDRFTLRAWHSTEAHDEAEIAAFVARFQSLLRAAAREPERAVVDLPFGSAPDRELWSSVNRTERVIAGPSTTVQRIQEQAPDATALVDGGCRVSYGELLARAAAVRDLLREHGVGPGDAVAVASGRGTATAAAVLGVWAAHAHYLPVDPQQPAARLVDQLGTADARIVLGDALGRSPVPVLPVPEEGDDGGPLLDAGPPDPDATAYVIFTSGSTGRPKAVAVTHANLANLVGDFAGRLASGPEDAVLWSTSTTFDISALELFLPLSTGATVVVADEATVREPRALLDLVCRHDVRVVQATPTAWRLVVPEVTDELAGRTVLCGGEPMPATLARLLRTLAGRVLNVYGPTETTIWSTAAELDTDPSDPTPVGVPLANTRIFVVDRAGHQLPPGVPGELCIAGAGVAEGYRGDPALTAARFGRHPEHGRFYRTGDVARLRHDGVLELAGRSDRQVKLRGHRIELGEVEAVLHEHPDVVVAAVVLHGDPQGDGRLTAFVRPRPGSDTAALPSTLWNFAGQRLPSYAVPGGVVVVATMPTTPSGKIDYPRLAQLDDGAAARAAAAPAAADPGLVSRLTALWAETLRRPGLTGDDNFFLNGGHSVLAAGLARRIEDATGHPVGPHLVFAHPTPAALAAHLASSEGTR